MRKNGNSPNQSLQSVMKQIGQEITGEPLVNSGQGYQSGFASPRTAFTHGWQQTRTANLYGSGGGTNMAITAPGMYSPLLTASAWQIPNNRREEEIILDYFLRNEPKLAAAAAFYADFPFSGYELQCSSSYVKDYFEKLAKRLNLTKWLPMLSHEYFARGNAFPWVELDCRHCAGSGTNAHDGSLCKHEGATWKRMSLLPPDSVEMQATMLGHDPIIMLKPNDQMIKVVTEKQPREIYESLTPEMIQQILNRQPIKLDPISIYHFGYRVKAGEMYGTSMFRPLLPTLYYKDKLRQANWTIAERHIVPFKVAKVGTAEERATEEDIADVVEQLSAVATDPQLTLVTHHAFDISYVGGSDKILSLSGEYETIEKEMEDGVMLNKAILNGEGTGVQSATVGLVILRRRIERFQNEVSEWIEEKIFKPVAMWNGFTQEGDRGQEEYIYPKIKFSDLQLKDNTGQLQVLMQMRQTGDISAEGLLEAAGLNYDQEVERLRYEKGAEFINSPSIAGTDLGNGFTGGMGAGPMIPSQIGMDGLTNPGGTPANPPGGLGMGMPMAQSDAYIKVASCLSEIYEERTSMRDHQSNIRLASAQSDAQRGFVLAQLHVTGRAYSGMISENLPDSMESLELAVPWDGGPHCHPINHYAIKEYREVTAGKLNPQPAARLFTRPERELYNIILSMGIPYAFYAQYSAGPTLEYTLDGAIPALRLGIEADSETFHSNSSQQAKDRRRDSELASQGWTILRFKDSEISSQAKDVQSVILQMIRKLGGYQKTESTGETLL